MKEVITPEYGELLDRLSSNLVTARRYSARLALAPPPPPIPPNIRLVDPLVTEKGWTEDNLPEYYD